MKPRLTKIDFRHPSDDFRQAGLTTDGNPLGFRHRRQPAPTALAFGVRNLFGEFICKRHLRLSFKTHASRYNEN